MVSKFTAGISESDPVLHGMIQKEFERQKNVLELIPSESLPSRAVLQALGSVLNNKYSEGYPGKRYYGGNQFIDEIETLAIFRCKQLFGCEHVNVQPYSGSPANIEIYTALLPLQGKILGMDLAHGGHLTHGHKLNFSGKFFNISSYGVERETGLIDMDKVRKIALEQKPQLILSGATAYPRQFNFEEFANIAQEVGAISMADISHIAGLIAGKQHPSPFPSHDVVMSTTHKTLCGPRGAVIMCKEKFASPIDKMVFPGMQGGPHEHQIAGKAAAFGEALRPEFQEFAKNIVLNSKAIASGLLNSGITLVSGGTDNHLVLVDLSKNEIKGSETEKLLDTVNITVNKNMIPFDERKPLDPSGIRLGSPTLTCRGFTEKECLEVGELIAKAILNHANESALKQVRERVQELTINHPIYNTAF